jgi:hypothetical protein
MNEKPHDVYVVELLAYRLAAIRLGGQELEKSWLEKPELRAEWRDNARAHIDGLRMVGIQVKATKPSVTEREAKELAIVPSRIAYVVGDD